MSRYTANQKANNLIIRNLNQKHFEYSYSFADNPEISRTLNAGTDRVGTPEKQPCAGRMGIFVLRFICRTG